MIAAFWLLVSYIRQEAFRAKPKSYKTLWISAALFFLVLSFLSPLLLGYISISGGKGTALYYAAVQFFLHFQFNGWLLFVVLGLMWDIIEQKNISLNPYYMKWGFRLLVISCFFTFALAVAWSTPHPIVYLINSLGVIIQLAAAILLCIAFYKNIHLIKEKLDKTLFYIFSIVIVFFFIKIIVQSAVVLPDIAVIAYTIRNYILAFIHLMLLGVISAGIIGIAHYYNLLNLNNSTSRNAIVIFSIGFLSTELLLFIQGTMQWASLGFMKFFHELMLGGSVLLALGIMLLLISQKNIKTEPLIIK
jgi:small basic protein